MPSPKIVHLNLRIISHCVSTTVCIGRHHAYIKQTSFGRPTEAETHQCDAIRRDTTDIAISVKKG